MVSAFLLGRSQYQPQLSQQNKTNQITTLNRDALPQIALPIILQEKSVYSDSFTQFTEALFDEFDFDRACELANAIEKEANEDILLRPHAKELRRAALLYVFEVQSRLFKQGNDLEAFCKEHNVELVDQALSEIHSNLTQMGLIVQESGQGKKMVQIEGNQFDVKGKIHSKTVELMTRTDALNKNLAAQVQAISQIAAEAGKRGT
jgi:hypothetical protein